MARYERDWKIESDELFESAAKAAQSGDAYLSASFDLPSSTDPTKITYIQQQEWWSYILNGMHKRGWELEQWSVFNGVGNGVMHNAYAVFKNTN